VGGLVVLAGLVAGALAWPELPGTMDVHWSAAGEADGTAPKAVGALLFPALSVTLMAVFGVLPRIDPLGENVAEFRRHYDTFVLLLVVFLMAVHGIVLAVNLGVDVPMTPITLVATGGLLAYAGVLLGHAEPNWFVGVRTPWTLSSERVWRRTHDVGGPLFAVAGVVLALAGIAGWALEATVLLTGGIGYVLLTAGVIVSYSYYCYHAIEEPGDVST